MATHLRENLNVRDAGSTCSELAAGLGADERTRSLASVWEEMVDKADTLATEEVALERAERRERARINVLDARWDAGMAAFGRAALDAADGRRDQSAYTRFFGKEPPSKVRDFGYQREVEMGRAWITELGRDAGDPLAERWIPELTRLTDALEEGIATRKAALASLNAFRTTRDLFIESINVEIDILEGKLLTLFAGERTLVMRLLEPLRTSRSRPSPAQPEGPNPNDP